MGCRRWHIKRMKHCLKSWPGNNRLREKLDGKRKGLDRQMQRGVTKIYDQKKADRHDLVDMHARGHNQETNGFGGHSGKHRLDIVASEEKQTLQKLRVKLGLQG